MLGDIWWTSKCCKYSGGKKIPSQTGPALLALSRFYFPQWDSLISKQGEQPAAHQPFPGTPTSVDGAALDPHAVITTFSTIWEELPGRQACWVQLSIQGCGAPSSVTWFPHSAKEASQPVFLNLCLCKISVSWCEAKILRSCSLLLHLSSQTHTVSLYTNSSSLFPRFCNWFSYFYC